MADSLTVSLADNVADTLLIPLYMRSLETQRGNGIINDPVSCELVDKIDYDFEKYGKSNKSQVGTAIRIRCFDRAVSGFLARHEDPVVVSIGAGLDTRFQRVYKNKGVFYELDLPEVIKLRRQLLPESENNPYLAMSMFDDEWLTRIIEKHPGSQFILIAEGVFMYFDEVQVRPLLEMIAQRIPQGELHFDVSSSWAVRNVDKHDTVKKSRAVFRWGLDDDRKPQSWSPYLRYYGVTRYMNQERSRWGIMALMGILPVMKNAFRMLHYTILPKA